MSNADQWSALKRACRRANISVRHFAERQGVSWSHLYRVIHGAKGERRDSPRLTEAVRAFLQEQGES